MRQKLMRTIETCVFSGRHGASKVVSVPIDNDCRNEIHPSNSIVLSRLSRLISEMAKWHPSFARAIAVACPMPDPEPVIAATFPENDFIVVPPW